MTTKRYACLLLLGLAPSAHAQDETGASREDDGLTVTFGASYGYQSLTGGISAKAEVSPLIDVDYRRGRFYASTLRGVGFNLIDNEYVTLGLGAGYDLGRKEKDDRRFRGLGRVKGSVTGAVTAAWRPLASDFWTVYAAANIAAEKDNGKTVIFGTTVGFPVAGKLNGFVDLSGQWNDRSYMQTYYGVTLAQSARSGYRTFTPDAGISAVTTSLGLNYDLSEHWSLGGSVGVEKLLGGAQDTPIYDDAKKTRPTASAFASYRF